MRIAVAGVGKRSTKVLRYLRQAMPEMQIVAYVDPSPAMVEKLQEPGDIASFDSVEQMLAATAPDLLFVGSPNHLHLAHIKAGLEAGVRIFTEKPVVTTMEQTWELVSLLAEHGTDRLLVGLVLRYAPQIKDLNSALAKGILGHIVSLEANEHIEPQHGGFFMRDWRRHTAYSGGFMLEKCCHDIDLYQMITGSRAKTVASFGGRSTFTPENAPADPRDTDLYRESQSHWGTSDDPFRSDADIIDHQTAIIAFENGVSMSFHTNINAPDESRHFCIIGTKAMAEGDLQRGYLKITEARSGTRLVNADYTQDDHAQSDHYGSDRQMGIELAEHFRGQRPTLPVSVVDAIEAGITAIAIDIARTERRLVDLTDTWARLDSFGLRERSRAHAV